MSVIFGVLSYCMLCLLKTRRRFFLCEEVFLLREQHFSLFSVAQEHLRTRNV